MTESFTNYEFELKYNFFMKPFLIQTHAQYGPDYAVLLSFLSGIIILACGLLQLGKDASMVVDHCLKQVFLLFEPLESQKPAMTEIIKTVSL